MIVYALIGIDKKKWRLQKIAQFVRLDGYRDERKHISNL
jgi:hypothetical protein